MHVPSDTSSDSHANERPEAPSTRFEEAPAHTAQRRAVKSSLPVRTWALLGATCLALTAILLMGDAPVAPVATSRAAKPAATAAAGEKTGQGTADSAATGEVQVLTGGAESGQVASSEQAAQLLVEGRHDEAIGMYLELSARHPDTPAYAAAARILQNRGRDKGR